MGQAGLREAHTQAHGDCHAQYETGHAAHPWERNSKPSSGMPRTSRFGRPAHGRMQPNKEQWLHQA